jgi:DNA-binding NtrC family response regulator
MRDILVVEDNDGLREVLKEALSTENFSVSEASSAEEGMEKLKKSVFDIVITDLKLPEADGIAVLEAAKAEMPDCDVIIITAYGTVDKAVDAMKKGAADFITKPFSIDQIRLIVLKIIKSKNIKEENSYLKSLVKKDIIGRSGKLKDILATAAKAALSDATILITGESGTGKELIAEEIHRKSPRSENPLIKVNCAALSPGILESELFGHEKGSFTDASYAKKGRFELADKGTIFLDEIADLPLELQVKLLRVIQEKEFERVGGEKTIKADVRIIAATNKDLKEAVKSGTFRQELYYRINVVEICMPPLRERREDIPELAEYFVKKYAEYNNFKTKGISREALDVLAAYDYPGNIRELENIIQRIMVMCTDEMIGESCIPYEVHSKTLPGTAAGSGLNHKMDEYERKMILEALNETKGNKARAAETLGINRVTLLAKIKKFRI